MRGRAGTRDPLAHGQTTGLCTRHRRRGIFGLLGRARGTPTALPFWGALRTARARPRARRIHITGHFKWLGCTSTYCFFSTAWLLCLARPLTDVCDCCPPAYCELSRTRRGAARECLQQLGSGAGLSLLISGVARCSHDYPNLVADVLSRARARAAAHILTALGLLLCG